MARKCLVCSSEQRDQIERELINGTSLARITKDFGIGQSSAYRHKLSHLPVVLAQAHGAAEATRAGGLLHHLHALVAQTEELYQQSLAIVSEARSDGDQRLALAAIGQATAAMRETRAHIELLGRLTGELENSTASVNVECVVMLPPPPSRSTTNTIVVEAEMLRDSERSSEGHHQGDLNENHGCCEVLDTRV
jgi:hypothetical protein